MLKREPVRIVRADAAGFVVFANRTQREVRWDDVERVTAFKRDIYVVDMVCLLLMFGADQAIVELNEQMEGYGAFVDAMDEHLPGVMPWAQWFLSVAFPAFAANTLCIYRKGGEPDPVPPPLEPGDPEPEQKLPILVRGYSWLVDKILSLRSKP